MVVPRLRSRQRGTQEQTAEEVQIMAMVVGAEQGCRTSGQKTREKGRQRTRGRSTGKKKKAKGQPQGGVQSDRGQGAKGMGEPGGEGQGGPGASTQGGVLSDSKRKRKGEVLRVMQKYPTGQGPGWNNKKADTNGMEGFSLTITWSDGTPTRSPTALAEAA